ncbi:MAG: glycosyl hydrolase family protein [Bryobacteraceae bacterium]
MTRRTFVDALALGGAQIALGRPFQGRQMPPGASISITVHPKKGVAEVPRNYNGLSYEAAQLGHAEFFAPGNKALIAFFRRLARHGVLRIGGNSSEYTVWSPAGAPAGAESAAAVNPAAGPPKGRAQHHRHGLRRAHITPEAIRNLAAFLDAADWQLIYGLNLGKGTPEQAAQEAKAVSEAVGRRLIAFQIGNEPDLYHRGRPWDLRPAGWDFERYFSQWQDFFRAVRKAVPHAPFGAPDVANLKATDWVVEFAERASNDIVLLSGHYYAEGPPTDPNMTIERLLARDPRLLEYTPRIMEASRKSHRPFRMTEGNSCFNGGKRGVSDTFASALWAADYMLLVAQYGYVGVNFHGGGNGVYTPIAGGMETGFSARPIYYGLLLGEEFAGTTMVETQVDAKDANVTAYAAKAKPGLRVAIFNKNERQAAHIALNTGAPAHRKATLWRLTAPSVESKTGVQLAGAEVSSDGAWSAKQEEPLNGSHGRYTVALPPASAAIVFLS